jgi:hypothetical protein
MRIIAVTYMTDYKLKLKFSGNIVKIVDLEQIINASEGIFLPLRDINYFKTVMLDDCELSICWSNGADICPDVLYAIGKEVSSKKASSKIKRKVSSSKRTSTKRTSRLELVKK